MKKINLTASNSFCRGAQMKKCLTESQMLRRLSSLFEDEEDIGDSYEEPEDKHDRLAATLPSNVVSSLENAGFKPYFIYEIDFNSNDGIAFRHDAGIEISTFPDTINPVWIVGQEDPVQKDYQGDPLVHIIHEFNDAELIQYLNGKHFVADILQS